MTEDRPVPENFRCEYAPRAGIRCDSCDCFVDLFPDDPFGLHPEAFTVVWPEAEGQETP